eukprot:297238_1
MAFNQSQLFIELHCAFESATQKTVRLKLPSLSDSTLNLYSIYERAPTKFPALTNVPPTDWLLSIKDNIIHKNDSVKFKDLISTTTIITIIKTPHNYSNNHIEFSISHTSSV